MDRKESLFSLFSWGYQAETGVGEILATKVLKEGS